MTLCVYFATALKVSKYGVFLSVFSVVGLNTGKYGPEKTLYLDTFHVVCSKLAPAVFFSSLILNIS